MLEISKRLYKLSEASGHKCYWCGGIVSLTVDKGHPLAATREHLVPKAHKAIYDESNVVLAHNGCNQIRATINANAFKKLMDGEAMKKYDLWPHLFSQP